MRIQLARAEVLARYLERRPGGETGEMGIVRAEIAKKRRHLPIRKLMEQAGSAVPRMRATPTATSGLAAATAAFKTTRIARRYSSGPALVFMFPKGTIRRAVHGECPYLVVSRVERG